MKKVLVVISLVSVILLISSCGSAINKNVEYSFDANGNYTGFKTVPKDYTPEQAEKDGCYISKNLKEIGGEKEWTKFVNNAAKGKDSSIRIMSIYDEGTYYEDLFFMDGSYQIFDSSSEDLKIHKYKYLLDLKGRMPNAKKDSRFVVLTDDRTLTYEKVSMSLLSSSMNVISSISSYKIVAGMGF
ncbi:MAG: hypothetical protein K0S04_3492 [Herbinix sp.]|jgi:hypothetical protein|nr:hypothetical protein [Herbinix sp.]